MRDICGTLGVNRGSFYYQPKEDPSEAVLLAEIEKLSGQYPTYGYRRITQLLRRQGYTVGTRRVARLMKEKNLLVSLKRVSGQTTKSLQGEKPWRNLLEDLEISHQESGLGSRYYLRPFQRTLHLSLSAHGCFHAHDQSVAAQSTLEPISDAQTAQRGIAPQRSGDSSFRSRRAVSFKSLCDHASSTWC